MIRSLAGILVELDLPPAGGKAAANTVGLIEPEGSATGYEVLLPAFLGPMLEGQIGQPVRFRTLHYLEAQGQGTSFIPRLIGFTDDPQRRFFEAFTTVKGLGYRRALRALAIEPAAIAELIVAKDAKGLTQLPEIGKRLAETVIAELTGKVEGFLDVNALTDPAIGVGRIEPLPGGRSTTLPPAAADAVEALITLGQTRSEAQRRVEVLLASDSVSDHTTESLLTRALGG